MYYVKQNSEFWVLSSDYYLHSKSIIMLDIDICIISFYTNDMTLFCTHGRVSGPSSLLDLEVMAPRGYSVPCQFWPVVRRHGRGVLWAGGDPHMTGCLECPLVSPVLAQSWSQTATDGAWYSTTALLSGRDRPRCLCVLRLSGSEPKTRRTGA